ncbi:UV-damaged DNA-binding protein rad7 [Sporothrix stenoceras]|uniref:UV-damaged DNA-binding protein rad7 n=1 Tax=Sporothrix stenoceras TaxID=5173 RepID=A0ABR3Z3G2_9PEZI
MSLPYKKALIVGATSGIGEALAIKLAENGTHVVAVGRREDRLTALVGKAPKGSISIMVLDITDLPAISTFASVVTAAHPDLDAVILNSGVQRAFDFGQPATVDLATVELELKTNYTAYVYLVTAFLPHLQALTKAGTKAYLIFISATLGLVPTLVRTPNYNASKAALHSFITTMRQQQIDAGFEELRVVEVFPPAVQTELHDPVHQPDLENGDKLGMPLAAFTNELVDKLAKDPKLWVGIGPAEPLIAEGGLEDQRQKLFEKQQGAIKEAVGKFLKKVRGRQNLDANGRPRVVGPQSALTSFLASRNISAADIEEQFRSRQAASLTEQLRTGLANGEIESTPETVALAQMAEHSPAAAAASISFRVGGQQLSAAQKRAVDKIKANKKKKKDAKGANGKGGKGKKRVFDSDEDEDEDEEDALARALLSNFKAEPLPGQMENCGRCQKRFTVTPYSRANDQGQLLCSSCGRLQDQEKGLDGKNGKGRNGKAGAAAKKSRPADDVLVPRGGPVGQRRKAQSRLLDGASLIGPKSLVTQCVEHLSKNIHLAEDLGDLPGDVIDRIARLLSKRRLINPKTVDLFIRPDAEDICVYDCGDLVENDFLRMLQSMPNLKHLRLYNAIQFKDDVMDYLLQRDVQLETLCLYGANLISATKWKAYLVERGAHLRTLQICDTDKHVTDEVIGYIKDCAPDLVRLKIRGNEQMGSAGVEHLGHLPHLQHINLMLDKPVHSDVLVKLLHRIGAGLQTLSLRGAAKVDNTVLDSLHQHARTLRKLRLTETQGCTDEGFVRLFEGWANPPLHEVDFEKNRFDEPDMAGIDDNTDGVGLCSKGFQALMLHSGSELRKLHLHACRHIGRDAFEEVFASGRQYPELRHIDVSFCGEVTDSVVRSMFQCCPNLVKLVTSGCMLVTGVQVPHGRVLVGVPNALGMQTVGFEE